MRICLDTDVLSEFLRGNPRVVSEMAEVLRAGDGRVAITIVTMYEVLKGLRHREAPAKEERFRNALKTLYILPLDESAPLPGLLDTEPTPLPRNGVSFFPAHHHAVL